MKKTIGIIGAMPSELDGIIKAYPNATKTEIAGFTFYQQENETYRLVFSCSGIAKVNSALCTQVLIDKFSPVAIINSGIAGGIDDRIKVCDIVISKSCMYHDLDRHFLDDYPPYYSEFESDPSLIEKASKICQGFGINYFCGRIVSGESFVVDNQKKSEIKEKFKPMAVDMETAAIAHCAKRNSIPFVSVRCISDNADDDGAMSFDIFEKKAANIVAKICIELASEI